MTHETREAKLAWSIAGTAKVPYLSIYPIIKEAFDAAIEEGNARIKQLEFDNEALRKDLAEARERYQDLLRGKPDDRGRVDIST